MGKGFKQADYKKININDEWKYARILNPIHNLKNTNQINKVPFST